MSLKTPHARRLANNDIADFHDGICCIIGQCMVEESAVGKSEQLTKLGNAAREADEIYRRIIAAAEKEAFDQLAAHPDEDIAAIGQAAQRGDWSGFAL